MTPKVTPFMIPSTPPVNRVVVVVFQNRFVTPAKGTWYSY